MLGPEIPDNPEAEEIDRPTGLSNSSKERETVG
jgi:hypothetical protein